MVQLVQVVQPVQNAPLKLQTKNCLRKDHIPPQAAEFISICNYACSALASIAAASASVIYSGLMSRPI